MNTDLCRDDSLELILSDQTENRGFDAVVDHLSHCSHCQQRLDDLAARPSWWNVTRRHLRHHATTEIPDLPAGNTLVAAQL